MALATADGGAQTGQLFLFVRDRVRLFDHVAAQRFSNGWNIVAGDVAAYVTALRVSEDYFDTLGVQPLLGRGFSRIEDQPNGPDAVVINEDLWRRAYAGRSDGLGQTILLGGVPHTVVGVMPAAFHTNPDVEVWTPLRTGATDNGQNYQIVPGSARRNAGAGGGRAQRAASRYSEMFFALQSSPVGGDELDVPPRCPRPERPSAVAVAPRGGGVVVAHRVRQCRRPPAHASPRAAPRNGHPGRARQQPRSTHSPRSRGIIAAGPGGALAGVGVALASARLLPRLVSEDFARQMLAGGEPTATRGSSRLLSSRRSCAVSSLAWLRQ